MCIYIYICVCVYECTYVCMFVWMYVLSYKTCPQGHCHNSFMYLKKRRKRKSRNKNQQNLKKILKHSNKPCGIEKWVFQSTRFKHTKRPRPK